MPLNSASILTLGIFLLGGVGWIIKRLLDKADERKKRKEHFRAFLRKWKIEADVSELDQVSIAYERKKADFLSQAEALRDYIRDKTRFQTLCADIWDKGHNAGQSQENRGQFTQAIFALIYFLRPVSFGDRLLSVLCFLCS